MPVPKPLLYSAGAASLGTYLELSLGAAFVAAHGPRLAAVAPAVLLGTGFWTLVHGFQVGKARARYAELARKDGEDDVDARYLLPNLYAQGTSQHVRAFNCVQRSHQHIFETYTTAVLGGLAGAASLPLCTAVSSLLYAVGRYKLSQGYAASDGAPSKRYASPLAMGMWLGFLGNVFLGMASCALVVGGRGTVLG